MSQGGLERAPQNMEERSMLLTMVLVLGYQDWRWVDPSNVTTINFFVTAEMLQAPLELDTDEKGNLYIGDVRANHVFKVSPRGEILFSFGRQGQGPGEFTTVYDLAIDKARGRVWVADQIGWRVACYDLEGKLLLQKSLSKIQPFAIACLDNGKVVIGGTGSNNLLLFNEKLEFEKAIGRTTEKPMERAKIGSQTSRFMTLTADQNRVYVAYYNEPVIACYDHEGTLVWEKERPWLNQEVDPAKTKLTSGGMAFEAEDYHRNLFVKDGVLYVSTAVKEHAVLAVDTKTGGYLGFRKVPENMYMRGLCYSKGRVYSVDPTEGLIRVHRFMGEPAMTSITVKMGYENRYVIEESLVIERKKNPASCSMSGTCICNHGKIDKCTSECCSGG